MNDRQRVEALIFPTFFLQVIRCGVREKDADYERCKGYLAEALEEALRGCDDKRRAQILRRTARLHDALTEEYRRAGQQVDKIGLTVLYTLQAVLDADYLVLEEGSRLAAAIDAIVQALGEALDEPKLVASARKQAARMLAHMQRLGVFEGVANDRRAA